MAGRGVAYATRVTGSNSPAPTANAAGPVAWSTVTLANDGGTLRLKKGGAFLLDLGLGFDWTVNVADPSTVSRIPNITVIRGAQGSYRAGHVGQTTLTAVGDPPCRSAHPACGAPSRLFRLTVVVAP
ncbi:MAG: hypothetical protein ACYDAG_09895 [Chloroflexota bacterium]